MSKYKIYLIIKAQLSQNTYVKKMETNMTSNKLNPNYEKIKNSREIEFKK